MSRHSVRGETVGLSPAGVNSGIADLAVVGVADRRSTVAPATDLNRAHRIISLPTVAGLISFSVSYSSDHAVELSF